MPKWHASRHYHLVSLLCKLMLEYIGTNNLHDIRNIRKVVNTCGKTPKHKSELSYHMPLRAHGNDRLCWAVARHHTCSESRLRKRDNRFCADGQIGRASCRERG